MFSRICALAAMILCLAPELAPAEPAAQPIPNLVAIEPGIYRGGRPGREGVEYLKSIGVRTIINLDHEEAENIAEREHALSLGIATVSAAINNRQNIVPEPVDLALRALADPALRPVFIHCEHGKNRTGMVYGLYRVENQGWEPRAAYEEMRKYGFASYQIFLKSFFSKRTGWKL